MRFALIGLGYWGRNYLRLLGEKNEVEIAAVCDTSLVALDDVLADTPAARVTADFSNAISDDIDAVIIATPATTHYDIAFAALESGKHVLCEKPLAITSHECQELIDLAEETGAVLFVGHTFIYNHAIRATRDLVTGGDLGRVRHCHAAWMAPGPVRYDVNSIWDLAPHPISILIWLFGQPIKVQARGQAVLAGRQREDVALVSLWFEHSVTADVQVSWVAPKKVRALTVTGDKRVAVFDDTVREDKLQVFDTEAALAFTTAPAGAGASARTTAAAGGPAHLADVPPIEPLRAQLDHFLDCCVHGISPESSGTSGQVVVRALEAAQRSLESDGARVSLEGKPVGRVVEAIRRLR
jgi:predicted dehydrogenase